MSSWHIPALSILACLSAFAADAPRPRLVDAHVHHNGDPAFLTKLTEKLQTGGGAALLITAPNDLENVKAFMTSHPNRLFGLGQISLDDEHAVELVDRFHSAGFRGLGEVTGPKFPYDDRRYSGLLLP